MGIRGSKNTYNPTKENGQSQGFGLMMKSIINPFFFAYK
jgi:hypothetical protein